MLGIFWRFVQGMEDPPPPFPGGEDYPPGSYGGGGPPMARIPMKSSMFLWKKYKKEDVDAYQNRVEAQMNILNNDRARMADRLNQLETELELWKANVYNKGQNAEATTEYTKQILKTREERVRCDFEKELIRMNDALNNVLVENDQQKILSANQRQEIKELETRNTELRIDFEKMKFERDYLKEANELLRETSEEFDGVDDEDEEQEDPPVQDLANPFYELFSSEDIFPSQREFGQKIVSKLVEKETVHALVYAPTQAGKTGSALCVAYYSQHPMFAQDMNVPSENIFLITGLSATSWSAQTQSRFPEFMSSNILHLQDVMKFKPPEKDVLILIDEMHIASKKDQTLYKFMKSTRFSSYDYCIRNNIKFVHISATPEGAWHSILPRHRAVIPMIPEKDSGYIGVKELIAAKQVKQCRNLITQNSQKLPTEDTISNIEELVGKVLSYDEPKYHIIRCPCPMKPRSPKKEKTGKHAVPVTPEPAEQQELRVPPTSFLAEDVQDEPHEIMGLQMVIANIKWVCKEIMDLDDDVFVYEENPKIEVIQKMLDEVKPRKHILIFIKNGAKCAVTFNKLHLGVLYDRFTAQSKQAVQMRFYSRSYEPRDYDEAEPTEIVFSHIEKFKNIKYVDGEYFCVQPHQWLRQNLVSKKGPNQGRKFVSCKAGNVWAWVDELEAIVNQVKLSAKDVNKFDISKTAVKQGTARESFVVQSLLGRATGYPKSAEERSAMENTVIFTDLMYVKSYIRDTYIEFESMSPSLGSAYPHVDRYMDDEEEFSDEESVDYPDEDTPPQDIGVKTVEQGRSVEQQENDQDVRRGSLF